MVSGGPIDVRERIAAIDIIRGFALFGVLWMNLFGHAGYVVPEKAYEHLATAPVDAVIGPLGAWLMEQKAQALFSLLFGFGFANIMARLEARGADAGRIYVRRIAILLALGLADTFLMWSGDILLPYALMGFLLVFTRRWKSRTLLWVGLALAVLMRPAIAVYNLAMGNDYKAFAAAHDYGQNLRMTLFQGSDYGAFVAEQWRSFWAEWYSFPLIILVYFSWILGRFMLGSWLFRKGWFDDVAAHRAVFRRIALIALPAGLVLAGLPMLKPLFGIGPAGIGRWIGTLGALTLACGYGAGIVMLHLNGKFPRLFRGLSAVGRMALTNYLTQSLFYVFAIYGFGLNLLPYLGATLSLGLAIALFAAQVAFSLWWLARYRFGPLEWAWRSLTYGERQAMRLEARPATAS